MPRYFFHTEDGQCIEDESGTQLPDLAAAKAASLRLLGEMLCDMPEFWETGTFRIIVRDEAGALLFTVDTCGVMAADLDPSLTATFPRPRPYAV